MSPAHAPGSAGCRELFAQLSGYLDAELDPSLCSRLEGHLEDCPPCRAFLESLRRTVDLTRGLPGRDLPEQLRRELVDAYRKLRDEGPS